MGSIQFAWLEITGKCQLACRHCYADSGPAGTHGVMTTTAWHRVLDELADEGAAMVQFIGGEPTLHPDLADLIAHARARHLAVEVFTNLVHVPHGLWPVFEQAGVSLATSYYTDDPDEHAQITRRPTHARTRANIAEATRREIPLRAGIINLDEAQRSDAAQRELVSIGVRDIGIDHVREVGRGVRDHQPDTAQLCGQCASGVIAISPDGDVWPCVFSRWMTVGNVLEDNLADILTGPEMQHAQSELEAVFALRDVCVPKMCDPQCGPHCSPACVPQRKSPCGPKGGCRPNYR